MARASQNARNLAAQGRLAARGIIVGTKGAEYRERVERATERGLTKAQAYGKAARSKQESITSLVARGARAPRPRRLAGGGTRRQGPGGATVTTSSDPGDLRRTLQRAKSAGEKVILSFKVETIRGTKSVALDGKRGKHIAVMVEPVQPVGAVQITQVPARHDIGVDPDDMLDYLDEGDWYDAIVEEYEEGDY